MFLLGGAGGAGLDQIHVQAGVLRYRSPAVAGQAWWVAPQFGVAAVAALDAARLFSPRVDEPAASRIAGDATWFVASYLASGLVDRRGARSFAAVLVFLWVARVARRRDRLPLIAYAAMLAVTGTAYEHLLAGTGAFSYARPGLGNVPAWLPGLYLQGAPLAVDLARAISPGGRPDTVV